jgi:hypothetical protein
LPQFFRQLRSVGRLGESQPRALIDRRADTMPVLAGLGRETLRRMQRTIGEDRMLGRSHRRRRPVTSREENCRAQTHGESRMHETSTLLRQCTPAAAAPFAAGPFRTCAFGASEARAHSARDRALSFGRLTRGTRHPRARTPQSSGRREGGRAHRVRASDSQRHI